MRMQRTARQHTTLQATAGVNSEDYFDFRPKQRVMTSDGYPGRIQAVLDGPHPGNEAYEVLLDGGMGGGLYASSQLHSIAEDAHTAAGDYPELEDVLTTRPDPAKQLVTARKTATTQNGTRIDGHGEAPHEVRAKDPNGYDAKSTEGDPDPLMSKPLTEKDEVGAHGGELGKGMSGVSFEGAMSPMQKQHVEDMEDARQDAVDEHAQVNDARRDRTDVGDVQRIEDPAYAKYLKTLNTLTVAAEWEDPEHGADWKRGDPFSAYEDDGRWHDPMHGHDDSRWSDPEHGADHTDEAEDSSTSHAAHLHLPEPEADSNELVDHMVDAHGYGPEQAREMMAVHRGLHGQHEMDHETGPGGMGLHPDDFAMPHDHPDRWLEHGSIPMPAGEPVGRADPAHAVEHNRPFELKPWHMNYSLSSAADPYALIASAAQDRDLGFQLTAAWADVRNKAKRIRSEGKVRITLASDGLVAGEVQGDHQTYETGIQRLPGSRHGVATWSCGCKWGAYHWGASDDFSRFAGRMCSHALALQFEAQSRGMFGKTVEIDTSKPDWVPPRVVVKYNPDTGHSDFAKSSSLAAPELSPLQVFCAYAGNDGETWDQITCLLSVAGLIEGSSNSPWGDPIAQVPPKPYGATQPANKWEDPGSAGFLATPDPDSWGGLGQNNQMYSTSSLDEAVFEPVLASPQGAYEDQDSPADPEGLEATLHDAPEPALPETDGGREDMVGEDAEDLTPEDQSMMTVGNQTGGADEILDETQNTSPQGLEDVVAAFQASAGAKAIMGASAPPSGPAAREGGSAAPSDGDIAAHARQVLALKAFSPAEQASLINEGVGERAANFDKLDIAGTHYADLESEDDATWLA